MMFQKGMRVITMKKRKRKRMRTIDNDVIQGDTPKDEDNEEEDDDEDDAQFVDNNPVPFNSGPQSQQAQ